MKRRNFLKLFPFAGLAAVFGIELRAEPITDEQRLKDIQSVRSDLIAFTDSRLGVAWDCHDANPIQDIEDMAERIRNEDRVLGTTF